MTRRPPLAAKDPGRTWGFAAAFLITAGWFFPVPVDTAPVPRTPRALAAAWLLLPGASLPETCVILVPLIAGMLAMSAARRLDGARRGRAYTGLAVAVLAAPFLFAPQEQRRTTLALALSLAGSGPIVSLAAFVVSLAGIGLMGRRPDRRPGRVLAALGGTTLLAATAVDILDALIPPDVEPWSGPNRGYWIVWAPAGLFLLGYAVSCIVAALSGRPSAADSGRRLAVGLLAVVAGFVALVAVMIGTSPELAPFAGRVFGIGGGTIVLLAAGVADWLQAPRGIRPAAAARP